MFEGLRRRARQLRSETLALYLAARHPDTPWYAKLLVATIVAYALSPIDLIPDFIPVLGHLDDLVLLPLGLLLAVRLVPPAVLAECRARAQDALSGTRKVSRGGALIVAALWLALAALCLLWAAEAFLPARP